MGCDNSIMNNEKRAEMMIRSLERGLNFTPNSCLVVDYTIRKYSQNTLINFNQWADIVFTLNLKTKNREESPNVEEFFNSFREGEFYETKLLQLTGMMLSTGKPRQRAKVIFEMYDSEHSGILTLKQIRQMVLDLIEISVYRIPILMNKETEEFNHIQRLRRVVEMDRDDIVEEFLVEADLNTTEEHTSNFFSVAFSIEDKGKLLTPGGMRLFINNSGRNGKKTIF